MVEIIKSAPGLGQDSVPLAVVADAHAVAHPKRLAKIYHTELRSRFLDAYG